MQLFALAHGRICHNVNLTNIDEQINQSNDQAAGQAIFAIDGDEFP